MMTVLRVPPVLYGFLIEGLRGLPISGGLLRHTTAVAMGLIVAALTAFAVWGATVAPQRLTLADLVAGKLSTMQSWIILSGEAVAGPPRASGFRYVLTDPAAPNARMTVLSDVELPVGLTTVSGRYTGGREPVPAGYTWIGTMHADPVVAVELGPPWVSMILVAAAVLVAAAARVSYPMFFAHKHADLAPRSMHVPVDIRRGSLAPATPPLRATLLARPGLPLELRTQGAAPQQLRLHSVHTGVDVGELRYLSGAAPALRVRQATDELTLTFASGEDRDAALGALVADAAGVSRELTPRKYLAAN